MTQVKTHDGNIHIGLFVSLSVVIGFCTNNDSLTTSSTVKSLIGKKKNTIPLTGRLGLR